MTHSEIQCCDNRLSHHSIWDIIFPPTASVFHRLNLICNISCFTWFHFCPPSVVLNLPLNHLFFIYVLAKMHVFLPTLPAKSKLSCLHFKLSHHWHWAIALSCSVGHDTKLLPINSIWNSSPLTSLCISSTFSFYSLQTLLFSFTELTGYSFFPYGSLYAFFYATLCQLHVSPCAWTRLSFLVC